MPEDLEFLPRQLSKIFIKPVDAPDSEYVELGDLRQNGAQITTLIMDEMQDRADIWHHPTSFTLQFRIKSPNRKKMLQAFGILKRPKCTYKTIKRDCAKRNRRW